MIDGYVTETRAGEQGAVVVRTATTETARTMLAQEGGRLDRSRHPGVVKLLEADVDHLTIAWAGAQTLEILAAPIPVLCGILTSVASTVADLHEIGIIHGRLDASHVVIDGDGRPRLCGMRGPAADERNPLPTDDVAAIGSLIDHLAGSEAEIEPIPERRWSRRRWTGYQRRALQLVADRASHEDPARRPTARELAAAIAEAVPEAQLAAPSRPGRPSSPAPPVTAVTSPVLAPEAEPKPTPKPCPEQQNRGVAPMPSLPPPPPPPAIPPTVEVAAPQPVESPTARPAGDLPTDEPSPTFLGLRIEPPEPSPGGQDAELDPAMRADSNGWSEGRSTPTRLRPPAAPSRRATPLLVVAAATAVVVLIGILAWGPGFGNRARPAERSALSAPAPTFTPAPTPTHSYRAATTVPTPARCSPTGPTGGPDLDGDGCPDPIEIDGTRVTAAGVSFEVGNQGDRVEVADWNCDGRATAAIVRPGTGEIFVFSRWVTAEEPVTVTPATVVPGAVSLVEPDNGPCSTDHLVRVVGGTTVPVDLQSHTP